MTFSQISSNIFKKITDHEKNENFDQTDSNASVFDMRPHLKIKLMRDESSLCLIREMFSKFAYWFGLAKHALRQPVHMLLSSDPFLAEVTLKWLVQT